MYVYEECPKINRNDLISFIKRNILLKLIEISKLLKAIFYS